MRMAELVTSSNSIRWALENLRAGDLSEAIETLEQHLDTNIQFLGAMRKKLDARDNECIKDTLRCIRDYRQGHPRRRETGFTQNDEKDRVEFSKNIDRIGKILEEIE
jgi:hypothetical protein